MAENRTTRVMTPEERAKCERLTRELDDDIDRHLSDRYPVMRVPWAIATMIGLLLISTVALWMEHFKPRAQYTFAPEISGNVFWNADEQLLGVIHQGTSMAGLYGMDINGDVVADTDLVAFLKNGRVILRTLKIVSPPCGWPSDFDPDMSYVSCHFGIVAKGENFSISGITYIGTAWQAGAVIRVLANGR